MEFNMIYCFEETPIQRQKLTKNTSRAMVRVERKVRRTDAPNSEGPVKVVSTTQEGHPEVSGQIELRVGIDAK